MDTNNLMASMLFGLIGMGMFMYGRKAGRMVALVAGVLLMVLPYFFTSVLVMTLVCVAVMALPWVIREA